MNSPQMPLRETRAGWAAALRHALARLRRGWRSGELLVLALALAVAAAAVVSVGLFSDRVRQAIERGSGDTLGADAIVEGHEAFPADYRERLQGLGLRTAAVAQFPSVVAVVDGQQTQLATIKAAEPGYPLRGALRLSGEPYGPTRAANGIPPVGEAWVDARLWSGLALQPGAHLQVGGSVLRVTALIADEPGRGGAFAEFAPELLMNRADLAATGLIGPGSRVQHILQLGGEPAALAAARRLQRPVGARLLGARDARPEISSALDRAGRFLDIAVLATILLSAAAVSLTARLHSQRLRDEVALLKCLGAGRGFVVRALTLQLVLLGLGAGAVGVVVGGLGQAVLGWFAAPLLNTALPAPGWLPLPQALALSLLMLLGFALPPVLEAAAAPPVRVFQRALDAGVHSQLGLVLAALAVVALVLLQAGAARLALFVIGGASAAAAVLALMAWLLVLALSPLRRRSGVAWRFGLGNIARRRGAAVAQATALGVALLALLLLTVVRTDLLASWRGRLPPDAPNQFLINIQPEQVQPLREFFAAHGYAHLDLWPMARARLVALNGKPVSADSFDDPETRRWINREFNMSWTTGFGDDNKLLSGNWWSAADAGQPWLSAEEYAVERLKLKLGDTLTLDLAGTRVTLTVHNTRKVRWDSFRPNFFLVTPPGMLDSSGATQWITSFYLAPGQHALLRDLVRQFPNVTAVDLDAALGEVRSIVDRMVHALEFIFAFTLGAGLVVMLAVIEASRAQRARETALLRTLGASSRVILQGLLAEYATLGLLAGSVAAVAAQTLAWLLAARVFDIPYGPRPLLWLAGAVAGCAVVTLVGWLSLRGVLRTPPRQVLAGS
ncbi:MAG: FtsX-like permease family protein [Nevskia sp.]|nr:FtsX-like permease family protein [Nevskia sp.]